MVRHFLRRHAIHTQRVARLALSLRSAKKFIVRKPFRKSLPQAKQVRSRRLFSCEVKASVWRNMWHVGSSVLAEEDCPSMWSEIRVKTKIVARTLPVSGGMSRNQRRCGAYLPVMVYPTRRDLHHKHPRWTDVCRAGDVLNELRDECFSRNRVAQKYSVGKMRPRSVQNRVVHL